MRKQRKPLTVIFA